MIQLVWTNCEGLFGIGWIVLGSYVVSDLIHSSKFDKVLWGYAALAVGMSLVNPYFVRGTLLPFTYLNTLNAASLFKQTILEFQSPWSLGSRFTTPTLTILSYRCYSALLAVFVLATLRRRRVHELLLTAGFFYLSATALRNIPLFVLATLPIVASSWRDATWAWLTRIDHRIVVRPAAAWMCAIVVWAFALRTVTSAHYISEGRIDRFGFGLDGETQPVNAAAFLVQHHLDGRIVNHLNVGGWLDWQRAGQVFIDGRTEVMGDEFYAESMAALAPGGLARLVAKYKPDILFFNATSARQWILDLNDMPEWRSVFVDEGACVFLRRDYAPEVQALDEERLLTDRHIANADAETSMALLQMPGPSWATSWIDGFYRPAVHPNGLQALALYFQYRREFRMSEALFLECIRRSRGAYYDFYFNAGLMYYTSDQYPKARICMDRVLRDDPGNAGAARILDNISGQSVR
jgi:hypothetical protein